MTVTGLCTYYPALFNIIFESTLSTYKQKFTAKQHAVVHQQQPLTCRVYRVS